MAMLLLGSVSAVKAGPLPEETQAGRISSLDMKDGGGSCVILTPSTGIAGTFGQDELSCCAGSTNTIDCSLVLHGKMSLGLLPHIVHGKNARVRRRFERECHGARSC